MLTANIGAYVTVKEQMALLADSALLSDSASLAAFVTAALSLNSALSGSEEYSSNQKQFNELFLGFLANGRIFTGADSVNLFDLANQCLYSGGPGVMEARALYNLIDRRYYFNDRALCSLMGGGGSRKAGETTAKEKIDFVIGIYPNPTNGKITIEFVGKIDRNIKIELINSNGQTVFSKDNIIEKKLDINISHLPKGIYYLVGTFNEKAISEKIILK